MLVHMYLDINNCIFNTFYYSSVCQGVLGLNFKTSSVAMRWDAEAEPLSIHVLNTVATAKPLTHQLGTTPHRVFPSQDTLWAADP